MFNSKLKAQVAALEVTVSAQNRNLELAYKEHARLRDKLRQSECMRHREPEWVDVKTIETAFAAIKPTL